MVRTRRDEILILIQQSSMSDVVIVGGGVVGLTIAWELAGRGLSVRVLDQSAPGREASWAGAGILPPAHPGDRSHPLARLTALSNSLWPRMTEELRDATGIDNGFRRCGGLEFGTGGPHALRQEIDAWTEAGVAVARLSTSELHLHEPALAADIAAGYRLAELCQVRNPRHLKALIAACEKRGVDLRSDEKVTDWDRQDGRAKGVRTERGVHAADWFVLAAGAWSSPLASAIGMQIDVVPVRGQIVLLDAPEIRLTHVLECGPRYVVPREDGHLLIGSTEENAGFIKDNTPEAIVGLIEFGAGLLPAIRQARIEKTWSGLRPQARRGRPWIGPARALPNVVLATGHFRAGLHLSPATARLVAQHICGAEPELSLDAFAEGGKAWR